MMFILFEDHIRDKRLVTFAKKEGNIKGGGEKFFKEGNDTY